MNLVKAQEYAQSLPLAELKKYADGFNPAMIPPWLATGEMQAKMKRAEMANTLQGAANGPQPSVKEQVEQKAGLFALQQAQQQAQAQQMMQPRMGAGPVPEGAPQPRPQPQQDAGLNQLPSNIQMAGGGIVAFAEGDKVEGEDDDMPIYARAWMKQRAAEAAKRRATMEEERAKNMALVASAEENLRPTMANDPRMLRAPAEETVEAPAPKAPANNLAALAALTAQKAPPRAAAPAAAPAAPAGIAAPTGYDALFRDAIAAAPKERTAEEIMAEQKAIRTGAGLGDPAGKAQLERIAALQKQYEASKPSGLDELIRVFGQAGKSKGLSGTGPAYTAMQTQNRADDLTMAQKINDLMSGVETTQRGEAKDLAGKVGEGRDKSLDRSSQFNREKMQTLGNVRGQDVQAASSKYNADMHYKAALAQMANANVRQDAQEKRLLLDSFKTRIASIDKELAPLLKTPYGPAKYQIAALQAEKAGLTKALDETSGIAKIAGAPSATSPSGTTRMRFDAQGNLVK